MFWKSMKRRFRLIWNMDCNGTTALSEAYNNVIDRTEDVRPKHGVLSKYSTVYQATRMNPDVQEMVKSVAEASYWIKCQSARFVVV